MSLRADLPRALAGAWLVLSLAAGVAVAAPFVLPAEALYGLFPECAARARGADCSFCGMTTAFVLLSRGELAGAREANAGAPILFVVFCANFLAALSYVSMRLLRRRQPGDQD